MLPDEVSDDTCENKSAKPVKNNNCGVKNYSKINGLKTMTDKEMVNGTLTNGTAQEMNDTSKIKKFDKNSTYFSGQKLIWLNVIAITIFHVIAFYSFITFPYLERWKTTLWGKFLIIRCKKYIYEFFFSFGICSTKC